MSKNANALLTECLVFITELGHGPACNTWSGRRDSKCDCDIPGLIRRINRQLKLNAPLERSAERRYAPRGCWQFWRWTMNDELADNGAVW